MVEKRLACNKNDIYFENFVCCCNMADKKLPSLETNFKLQERDHDSLRPDQDRNLCERANTETCAKKPRPRPRTQKIGLETDSPVE